MRRHCTAMGQGGGPVFEEKITAEKREERQRVIEMCKKGLIGAKKIESELPELDTDLVSLGGERRHYEMIDRERVRKRIAKINTERVFNPIPSPPALFMLQFSMRINVTCIGAIARTLGVTKTVIDIETGSNVARVISALSADRPLRCLVTVNGKKEAESHAVFDGDTVKLIPIVGAG